MVTYLFSLFVLLILFSLNGLSLIYRNFQDVVFIQSAVYVGVYLTVSVPFFIVGSVLAYLFSTYHDEFNRLYFWDLVGASLGCVFFIPFLPKIGAGGLLFIVAALGLLASSLFTSNELRWQYIISILGLFIFCIPFAFSQTLFDFKGFENKRNVIQAQEIGALEKVIWDPISKIQVFRQVNFPSENLVRHVAYDGGTQSSYIYPFDGDYEKLRGEIPHHLYDHFWQRGVFASHYLKNGARHTALIIGSAGGQETKGALLFGASKVDAVEMVNAVVQLGTKDYAEYNGNIFNDPRVSVHVGEGRAFLRNSQRNYDVIQIFSNHSSSSIAAGSGLISPVYLQTVEAYEEYFSHLNSDGILHINHHLYPRVVTIAAKAWKLSGRNNFQDHVVIFERNREKLPDTLPTILIKMSPWTKNEVDKLKNFYFAPSNEPWTYTLVADPINKTSEDNFLNDEFFSGSLTAELKEKVPYNLFPPTDNRPFFNFFRKNLSEINTEEGHFYNFTTTGFINNSKFWLIPSDLKSLFLMFLASLVIGSIILFLPFFFKDHSIEKMSFSETVYFCLLGFGFISIEFVLIQMYIKVIGNPLYSFSTIIFTLLLSAGLGSLFSKNLLNKGNRFFNVAFWGIFLFGFSIFIFFEYFSQSLLSLGLQSRILLSSLSLFPIGFFLGMPLPLGIKLISIKGGKKVPWAWALNGFFTVFGGFLSIVVSLIYGFKITFLTALFCYLLAMFIFNNLQKNNFR